MSELVEHDFTPTVHRTAYPAISPLRPELSQVGRVVLITGGGTGIGKSIAEHFILASAAAVIIIGRRLEILETAAAELSQKAQASGRAVQVVAQKCDVTSKNDIDGLWKGFAERGLLVDVLVHNAAKFTEPKPFVELGALEIWSQVEANFSGPLFLTEKFMKQNLGKKKFLINITSAIIHTQKHPLMIPRGAYILSKTAGTLLVQLFADQHPIEELQVITYHPGLLYGHGWESMGVTKDMFPFDELDLPGAFAVWAASTEAAFANGRILWASWDVEQLATGDVRKQMEEDADYLRVSVVGMKESKRAPAYT